MNEKRVVYGNFYEHELFHSDVAAREGIDNTTKDSIVLRNAQLIAQDVLMEIRNHYGIPYSPLSWYRCENLERILTDKAFHRWALARGYEANYGTWLIYFEKKQHPIGQAADPRIPGDSTDELFNWCKKNLEYDQLIKEFYTPDNPYSGWVHCSKKFSDNRMMAFEINS